MGENNVVASTTERVKDIVRKAKEMVGLKTRGDTTADKVKSAIDRAATKAREGVDGTRDVVTAGTNKAKSTAKTAGKKVKQTGQKLEDRGS